MGAFLLLGLVRTGLQKFPNDFYIGQAGKPLQVADFRNGGFHHISRDFNGHALLFVHFR